MAGEGGEGQGRKEKGRGEKEGQGREKKGRGGYLIYSQ